MVKSATMAKVTKIHQGKQPVRRHYLAEWLEAKQMTPVDLLEQLNDPERSMGLTEVDKSQVYRWLKGQMPQAPMQLRIAGALGFEDDPGKLLEDPTMDWLSEFFRDKTEEQKEKAIQMLKLMFADIKTGTDG
ncbi:MULTISPECIES: helix-turn-helix domain-containing protein [Rhizobium/Agrobacterium group]|uniref:helix-turn-helix domain-containing protein n=1 Tax=Rhizobium oryzihabitans TaxID=2267833 RepID=UPI004034DC8E